MNYTKIISCVSGEGTAKIVTFDRDVSNKVQSGCIAYNTACNSGNYVIRKADNFSDFVKINGKP